MISGSRIAFIGLGQMGAPMARNLALAGASLSVFDENASRLESAVEGAFPAGSCQEAVQDTDFIILMLPDGTIMREVLLSPSAAGGSRLIDSIKPGALIVDMGSSDPYLSREVGETLRSEKLRMIDAPVSGGVKGARTGELAIIVGGEAADVEECRPILEHLGTQIFHVGPLGAGQAMKAINNLVSASGLLAVVEALKIGEKFGLDADCMVDVLNASSGRNNTTENKVKPYMLSGAYNSGFAMRLMVKDLSSALEIAVKESVSVPASSTCFETWKKALQCLGGKADHTEMHRWVMQRKEA